jgi:hypothetical protein
VAQHEATQSADQLSRSSESPYQKIFVHRTSSRATMGKPRKPEKAPAKTATAVKAGKIIKSGKDLLNASTVSAIMKVRISVHCANGRKPLWLAQYPR